MTRIHATHPPLSPKVGAGERSSPAECEAEPHQGALRRSEAEPHQGALRGSEAGPHKGALRRSLEAFFPESGARAYSIYIGSHLLEEIATLVSAGQYTKVFVVTDEVVAPLFLERLLKGLPAGTCTLILPAGEKAKNPSEVNRLWKAFHGAGLDRKSLVLNLGGGAITDVGGFAASTYMRGLAFVHIPTTLLGQVDATIGGKTGLDFDGVKNLIGTFAQPRAVVMDLQTLKTLPECELVSGFAEVLKHGLIADRSLFERSTEKKPGMWPDEELADLICRSCEIKLKIIQQDERETGLRKLLNFGHTVGHAIEALSWDTAEPLLHGEAVSIGMVVEARMAHRIGRLPSSELLLIQEGLVRVGLPIEVPSLSWDAILAKMQSDKKNEAGRVRITLLEGIGIGVIDQEVSVQVMRQAFSGGT